MENVRNDTNFKFLAKWNKSPPNYSKNSKSLIQHKLQESKDLKWIARITI